LAASSFDKSRRLLNGLLFFLLLGFLLLFLAYWGMGAVPDTVTLINVALVALTLVGAGAVLLNANTAQADQFYRFCSSGLFFIGLGLAFLFIANWSMGRAHAGMSFVLVVLGVAVVLYGTGTQGMGELKSDGTAGKYNVAIAGGAGVLAFFVAYGIIEYSPKMRDAFQTERKFVRLLIKSVDGSSNIPSYAPMFEIDGTPIPAARRGNVIEVFVPYLSSELVASPTPSKASNKAPAATPGAALQPDDNVCKDNDNLTAHAKVHDEALSKTISAIFYRVEAKDTLKPKEETKFRVRLDQNVFDRRGGGTDFPIYPVQMCVNLQAQDSVTAVISQAGNALRPATDRDEPTNVPNLILNQIGVQ